MSNGGVLLSYKQWRTYGIVVANSFHVEFVVANSFHVEFYSASLSMTAPKTFGVSACANQQKMRRRART